MCVCGGVCARVCALCVRVRVRVRVRACVLVQHQIVINFLIQINGVRFMDGDTFY